MNSFDKFLAIAVICVTAFLAMVKAGWPALAFGAVAIAAVVFAKGERGHE